MKALNQFFKFAAVTILLNGAVLSRTMASEAWVLDFGKANTKVDFHADGKIMKVHAENGKATGSVMIKDGKVTGQAVVDLIDIKTGIELRDEHLKSKYLEVSKFPKATLDIVEIKLPTTLPNGSFEAPFKGNLTVHGVMQSVSGIAKLEKNGSALKGEVEFNTTISGHKIELPKYSGIIIKDNVKVKVEFNGQLIKSIGSQVAKK